ncbi:MAG: hypothetical protein WBW82_11975, partial [Candidatus Sulfotelmatobacter sp.]
VQPSGYDAMRPEILKASGAEVHLPYSSGMIAAPGSNRIAARSNRLGLLPAPPRLLWLFDTAWE